MITTEHIFYFMIVLAVAVGLVFAFGFFGEVGEKVNTKLRVPKGGFLEWLVLAIFVLGGMTLVYYLIEKVLFT